MSAREVWLIESGDYEQHGVDAVAESVEAAVAWLKASHPPPYVVRWGEVRDPGEDGYTDITGHFDAVPGYSTQHMTTYSIERWNVVPNPDNGEPRATA